MPCSWYGIVCENGSVTTIGLNGHEYRGNSINNNLTRVYNTVCFLLSLKINKLAQIFLPKDKQGIDINDILLDDKQNIAAIVVL